MSDLNRFNRNKSEGRKLPVLFFILLGIGSVFGLFFLIRYAFSAYSDSFGGASFSGLSKMSLPLLIFFVFIPVLAIMLATLLTFRAIGKAKRKEEENRDGDEEDSE